MHSLTHSPRITETGATERIMEACRSNAKRNPVTVKFANGKEGKVTFTVLWGEGEYEACLRDEEGFVVALANVDWCDI